MDNLTFGLLFLLFIVVATVLFLTVKRLFEVSDVLNTLLEKSTLAPATAPNATGNDKDNTNALRLQACERLTLMLERINVPNLLLRLSPSESGTARYVC